jgi:hypothetical protein
MTSIISYVLAAAVKAMEQDLPATSGQFSLSLSLFVLVQGLMPNAWTALGEIKGRKVRLLIIHGLTQFSRCVRSDRLSVGFSTLYGSCYRYCSESLNRTVSKYCFLVTTFINLWQKCDRIPCVQAMG